MKDKKIKLLKVIKHINIAIKELNNIKSNADDYNYYSHKLSEILSCDNGQSGLKALLKRN